jgi:cyclophilin family peptidyl-prolyl cis-trans isomerase
MNVNITHAVFAFFVLYFMYDNYKKYLSEENNSTLSLYLKNIISNFQELLFSKKNNKIENIKNTENINNINNINDRDDNKSIISISRKSMDNEDIKQEENIEENIEQEENQDIDFNYDYILDNENIDFDLIPKNTNVYFDIGTKDKFYGTIIFKLYDDICPITANNFRKLSVKSPIEDDNQPAYTGCNFFRIIKNFMIQSGDFEHNDGNGGVSIYGEHFEDENLTINLDKPGLLVSANKGPNTNNSQFFITTSPAHHLDGKHVVFGEVISGMDIVKIIEDMNVNDEYYPTTEIYIRQSGLLLKTI